MKPSLLAAALCLTSLVAVPAAAAPVPYAAMAVDANKILAEVDKRAAAFDDQRYNATMEILKGGELKKKLVFKSVMRGVEQQLIEWQRSIDDPVLKASY